VAAPNTHRRGGVQVFCIQGTLSVAGRCGVKNGL
jgi:hypothetical protein